MITSTSRNKLAPKYYKAWLATFLKALFLKIFVMLRINPGSHAWQSRAIPTKYISSSFLKALIHITLPHKVISQKMAVLLSTKIITSSRWQSIWQDNKRILYKIDLTYLFMSDNHQYLREKCKKKIEVLNDQYLL